MHPCYNTGINSMKNINGLWASVAVDITHKPDTEPGLRMQSGLDMFSPCSCKFCFMKMGSWGLLDLCFFRFIKHSFQHGAVFFMPFTNFQPLKIIKAAFYPSYRMHENRVILWAFLLYGHDHPTISPWSNVIKPEKPNICSNNLTYTLSHARTTG